MTTKLFLSELFDHELVNDTGAVLQNGAGVNCLDGLTFTHWLPNIDASQAIIQITLKEARAINYVAITDHNLKDKGITSFIITASNVSVDDPLHATQVLLSGADIDAGINFQEAALSDEFLYYRILITRPGGIANQGLFIGNVFIGQVLELPEGIQPSYTPPHLAVNATIENSITMGGNFVGRSLTLEQYDFVIKQDNISPEWIRANWLDLLEYIQQKPFFYLWDDEHKTDLVFCWTKADIAPPAYSNTCYMSFSFNCNGFIEHD